MNGVTLFGSWLERLADLDAATSLVLKASVVLLMAWCGHAALRPANPRWRVLMWRCTAFGLLLLPAFDWAGPSIEFAIDTTRDVETNGLSEPAQPVLTPTDNAARAGVPVADGEFFIPPHPPRTVPLASRSFSWDTVLLGIWLVGCAFGLLRVVMGMSYLHSLVRRSQPAPDAVAAAFARVLNDHATRRFLPVNLRVSSQVTAPVLCGVFRNTLLIPERMTDRDRSDRLPGVFAHELAHVTSGDLAWNFLLHLVAVMLWFHPFAWSMRRAHASACESVSDSVAATYVGDVSAYCRTLARVALDALAPPPLTLAMARPADVQRRIHELEKRVFRQGLSRRVVILGLLGGVAVAGTLGGLKAVHAALQPNVEVQGETSEAAEKSAVDATAAKKETDGLEANVETAIDKGLSFLRKRQREDGSFGGETVAQNDPAMTALCGLAFLASGSKPGEGPHGEALQRAIDFLLANIRDDGYIGLIDKPGSMYVHAYALRFLSEAHAVRKAETTKKAVQKAVDLLVNCQNAQDGWRYIPQSQDSDSSVTACVLIALQSARRAGISVPRATLDRAVSYLQKCQAPDGGYAYVLPANNSALPRSAATLSGLRLSGVSDESLARAIDYVNARSIGMKYGSPYYFYTQYHLATALGRGEAESFQRWYQATRDQLLKAQADDGSWSLRHYPADYPTAQACIVLLSPKSRSAK